MSSVVGKIGLFVAKQAVNIFGANNVAKTAVNQAVKNPNTVLKVANMIIKSAIKR